MANLNLSGMSGPVTVDLQSGDYALFTPQTAGLTTQVAYVDGLLGWSAVPLFTVGETLSNGYVPQTRLDGIAAFRLNATTVRVYVNHELTAASGSTYTVTGANGASVALTGARVDYFDMNVTTKAIVGGGVAYSSIYNRAGQLVSSASQLENGGLDKFCSSVLVPTAQYGAGTGVRDTIYFTGEENTTATGGSFWALDAATKSLHAVPDLGRGRWENIWQVPTGDASHVAFMLSDDTPGAALYLYIGTKVANGDFLSRNGLEGGTLYVWCATAGDATAATFSSGSRSGVWKAVGAQNVARAGQAGYDALGYKNTTTLAAEADALGAFSIARVEDLDGDPLNGNRVVIAATGNASFDGGSNTAGTLYTMTLNLSNLSQPKGTLAVLHNANTAAGQPIRSPDNVEWSADGWIYVQEDKAADLFSATATNPLEASILRINPLTGAIQRIATVDRQALSPTMGNSLSTTPGSWETTGITDVSLAFGGPAGTMFLTNVMAHGATTPGGLEGGQMLLLSKPGTGDHVPSVDLGKTGVATGVIGTNFADRIYGSAAGNWLFGGTGNDVVYGRAGNDHLVGGAGRDTLVGGLGKDLFHYSTPSDKGDIIASFAADDVLVFEGSRFGLGSFAGNLSANRFSSGLDALANDADDRFVYDQVNHNLWFDPDGTGPGIASLMVHFRSSVAVTAADILIT